MRVWLSLALLSLVMIGTNLSGQWANGEEGRSTESNNPNNHAIT
jgi:hypothetical protein